MKNVSHQNDVCLRKGIGEKVATNKPDTVCQPVLCYIFFKDRPDLGQIESDSRQVRMLQSNLHGKVALRSPNIHIGRVIVPGEVAIARFAGRLSPDIARRNSLSR